MPVLAHIIRAVMGYYFLAKQSTKEALLASLREVLTEALSLNRQRGCGQE